MFPQPPAVALIEPTTAAASGIDDGLANDPLPPPHDIRGDPHGSFGALAYLGPHVSITGLMVLPLLLPLLLSLLGATLMGAASLTRAAVGAASARGGWQIVAGAFAVSFAPFFTEGMLFTCLPISPAGVRFGSVTTGRIFAMTSLATLLVSAGTYPLSKAHSRFAGSSGSLVVVLAGGGLPAYLTRKHGHYRVIVFGVVCQCVRCVEPRACSEQAGHRPQESSACLRACLRGCRTSSVSANGRRVCCTPRMTTTR